MASLFEEHEIRALLDREEGQYLEFKSLWDREHAHPRPLKRRKVRDWIAEYVAAFANNEGGTIVLGVEDDGTPTGHAYPWDVVQEFLAVPEKRLRPPVRPSHQRVTIEGEELVVLQVDPEPMAVMVEGNGFPFRAGDQIIRETQEVINERKAAYRRSGYEQRVQPVATMEDLDLELARALLSRTPRRGRTIEELLEHYGLAVPQPGKTIITNAALLLFGKIPLVHWHPRAGVRFFRVEGKERKHGARRNVTQLERIELPIASAIPMSHRFMASQIRRSEKLYDLFFKEMPEYPEFAWQEALINAIAHRDYSIQSQEVEVWFYEDRLEILNPGELVPPVTLEDLRARRQIHASRNPLIVRVLAEAGIMREEGEGIPRMFEEMEESLLRLPELSVASRSFKVTLRNEPIYEGPSPEWQHLVQQMPLAAAQRRVLIAKPRGFTNGDYRELNHVNRDEAYREIQDLVSKGIVLSPTKGGRGAIYRVAPDVRTARVWLEKRVPKIREYLSKAAYLKNADYRDLFGVTRATALKELRRLVEEDFLRLEGERRGARYSAGAALASSGARPLR